jgi:hypothetical protein
MDVIHRIAKEVTVPPDFAESRAKAWATVLGLQGDEKPFAVLRQAACGAVGQFNFWEGEFGQITWASNSSDWFAFIRGEKSILSMNYPGKRAELKDNVTGFLDTTPELTIDVIADPLFWSIMTHLFGGDPLRKRETLLWIMLDDLRVMFPEVPEAAEAPNRGCIDYNIILYLRYMKAITDYEGNRFDLYTETQLRTECLHAVEMILEKRPDLTVSSLDSWLWEAGRKIRHELPQKQWEPYFCYRIGCYFY